MSSPDRRAPGEEVPNHPARHGRDWRTSKDNGGPAPYGADAGEDLRPETTYGDQAPEESGEVGRGQGDAGQGYGNAVAFGPSGGSDPSEATRASE